MYDYERVARLEERRGHLDTPMIPTQPSPSVARSKRFDCQVCEFLVLMSCDRLFTIRHTYLIVFSMLFSSFSL